MFYTLLYLDECDNKGQHNLNKGIVEKVTMTSWHFSNKRTMSIKSISVNIKKLLVRKQI